MDATRKRRIVRRALWTLAVVVLMPVWYVGSYWSLQWLDGAGMVSGEVMTALCDSAYAPLLLYINSEAPGGEFIARTAFRIWAAAGARGLDIEHLQ